MSETTANHNSSGSSSLNTILFILITCMISAFIFTSTTIAYLGDAPDKPSTDITITSAAERDEQTDGLNVVNIVLLTMVSATLPLVVCVRLPSRSAKKRPHSLQSDQGHSNKMHRNITLS